MVAGRPAACGGRAVIAPVLAELPWRACSPPPPAVATQLRRQAIFACRKWDPQVGDVATISSGALVLTAEAWHELSDLTTAVAAETRALEAALLRRPELWRELGVPRALRRALATVLPGPAVRSWRFDWHFTTAGWRLSEVNADVPGGYNEAGGLGLLWQNHLPGTRTLGDPAARLARALAVQVPAGARVALVHATAYSDDRQVMEGLAAALAEVGLHGLPCAPDHLTWDAAGCQLAGEAVAACLRFTPGEWLPGLPRECAWRHLLGHARVLVGNPGSCLLVQSKRLPLLWDRLGVPCPTWRAHLPETRAVQAVAWRGDPDWILKPTWGRVGEGVVMQDRVLAAQDRRHVRWAHWWPGRAWVAQRRFVSVPWDGPDGPCHPCLGVYTLDGAVTGVFGRTVARPPINGQAVELGVLAEDAGGYQARGR